MAAPPSSQSASPPDGALAVSCRGVGKVFGRGDSEVHALRGVDLDVRLGAMTMLMGPSGCGKTTLLSVITGLLDQTAGHVTVLGADLAALSSGQKVAFRRQNLGFVFQQYNLLPALTAAENVAVPLLAAGLSRREAVARGRDVLARLGMPERAHARPPELSGGQQQRVALGRALIHQPRLIVCDEPTAALDAETGHAVMELLAAVAVAPDRAVIVVTHDTRVLEFADTIAHMDDGRISRVQSHEQSLQESAP